MSDEEMIHCPYNFSHVILKSRMASHLQKCREQYPLEKFTTCPFNATHDVPIPELKYHAESCPDRKTMEKYLYVMEDEKEEEELAEININIQALSLEENWDDEKVSGSYLEAKDKVKMDQKIFKALVGKTKSEKKAFTQSQVEKFQKQDKEKSKKKSEPSLVKESCKVESRLLRAEPEAGSSRVKEKEEEEFVEVVSKSKKRGIGRGSTLRDASSKKNNT